MKFYPCISTITRFTARALTSQSAQESHAVFSVTRGREYSRRRRTVSIKRFLAGMLTATCLLMNATVSAAEQAVTLGWDDLIPQGYRPMDILAKYNLTDLKDDDPRANDILREIQAAFKTAPLVEKLNGKLVRLPGYVVPLEGDGKKVSEFLLVPYYGACIHVPPPPANQTVFVSTGKKKAAIRGLFDTVWVTGRIDAERTSSELAEAGYLLRAVKVEPYK